MIGTRRAPSRSRPDTGHQSHGLRWQGQPRCSLTWSWSCCGMDGRGQRQCDVGTAECAARGVWTPLRRRPAMMTPRSPALCQPHMTLGERSQRIGSMWKLPPPVDRKLPPQSPRARISVVWSATRRPPVRPEWPPTQRSLSSLSLWARDGGAWRRRVSGAAGHAACAQDQSRPLATLFYPVKKHRSIQGRCDAEWDRRVSTATSDRTCCSPGTFRPRRGFDPGAPATKLGASRSPDRAHPVAVT